MDIVSTRWPDVAELLSEQLLSDPYVRWHLMQDFGGSGALRVCGPNVLRSRDAPYGLEIWLEAHDDGARRLLRELPAHRNACISIGTPLGLQLVQEEMEGRIGPLSLFCMVDRGRLRPQGAFPVRRLSHADRDAVQRYATSHNAKMFLRYFDEEKVALYGCYQEEEIVGCCGAFPGDTVSWLEVKPELRRRGYGRCLLSACVADMLQEHEMVFYEACMDEIANVRVSLPAGFVPIRQTFFFEGKRPGR